MKTASRIVLLGICFYFLLPEINYGQSSSRRFHVFIDSVVARKDTMYLLLRGGSQAGIKPQMQATIIARHLKEQPQFAQSELGFGTVLRVMDQYALLLVKSKNSNIQRQIQKHDLVRFNITPPGSGSIFTELAAKGIIFADNDRVPHYSIATVFEQGGRLNEDSLIAIMQANLRATLDLIPVTDTTSNLVQPLKDGRYRGKTVVDLLRTATENDIRSFLYFVLSYPGKYMGYTYKFNEAFATWILNEAPTGDRELLWQWTRLKNQPAALADWYKKNAAIIREEKLAGLFFDNAVTHSQHNETESARQVALEGLEIAQAVQDTLGKAMLWQALAQVYQDQEAYRDAIASSDSVIKYSRQARNAEYLMDGYFKKVYCLHKINAFPEGRQVLATAEKDLRTYGKELSVSDSLDNWRKRYEYAGWIEYAAGNYGAAINYLQSGIDLSRKMQTRNALSYIASDYWYLGRIFYHQGLYPKSLLAFDSSLQIYQLLDNAYYIAYTQNEIGRVYYSTGKYKESISLHQKAYDKMMADADWEQAGYSKSMIGSNLQMENDIPGSILAHTESIDLRRKAGNKKGQAKSWVELGKLYERIGKRNDALLAYDSAAYFFRAIGDSAELAQNLLNKGSVYEQDKDVNRAEKFYLEGAGLLKRLQSSSGYIDALMKLGSVNWSSNAEASERYYRQGREEAARAKDSSNLLYATINIASLAYRKERFDEATRLFTEAQALARSSRNPDMEAFSYQNIAGMERYRMNMTAAISYLKKAEAIYDTLDKQKFLKVRMELGSIYKNQGKWDSAAAIDHGVVAEAARLGYRLQQGDALLNLSFLDYLRGRYKEGMLLADSAQKLYEGTGNANSLAGVLETKANLYNGMGRGLESIRYYDRADSIYQAENNNWGRSNISINKGAAYFHQGNYRKSIDFFHRALDLLPLKSENETRLLILSNLAECHAFLKQYDTALSILEPAFQTAKKQQLPHLSSGMAMLLARIYTARQQPDRALPLAQEAFAYADRNKMPYRQTESLMYLGMLNQQRDTVKALKYLQQATVLAKAYEVETVGWEAFFRLGEYYYARKQFPQAITAYKGAVQLIDRALVHLSDNEEDRKIYQNSGQKPELYSRLISALTATGATEEAWAFAQKFQQEAIRDLMGDIKTGSGDAAKSGALQQLMELQQRKEGIDQSIRKIRAEGGESGKAQLEALQKSKLIVEKEYLNYVNDLVAKYPEIDGYFAKNVNPEDFKEIKESIPDSMAVVLYLLNGKQLLIFTATQQKIGVREQWLTKDLEPMVDAYVSVLSNPSLPAGNAPLRLRTIIRNRPSRPAAASSFQDMSQELYRLLIAPIESELEGIRTLCIIPNGKLSNLPFQCLGKKVNDTTLNYLVEHYGMFYTNKLTMFLKKGRTDRQMNSFTGFGNPDNSLESAGQEVQAIGKILNTGNIYLQAQATEARAKAGLETTRYVHFATHGVLNYADFNASYLRMANETGGADDGELRLDEIKRLSINGCELVTLSACETAVNQELKKGWYISPANAFLVSSVRSVVASLWAVDDVATNLLMQEFYKNLSVMDKQQALRKAQATLSAKPGFAHPFYWGAFVLYGDWR